MRPTLLLFYFLAAFCTFSGCTDLPAPEGSGALAISLSPQVTVQTKGSDVTERSFEKVVNQLQLFLFKDGVRYDYISLQGNTLVFPYTRRYASLESGRYAVYAVANGPDLSTVTAEAQLQSWPVTLADCSLSDSRGFVMAAAVTNVLITAGTSHQLSLSLQRFASRVQVVSIRNQVPSSYAENGAVTIRGIFLENANSQWNLQGTEEPFSWVNLGGRQAGKQASNDRSDFVSTAAHVPESFRTQLYRDVSKVLVREEIWYPDSCGLYAFPNRRTVDHTGASATVESGALSRLVVLARVNGADWWYPVTLFQQGMGLERNTSYDVTLVIRATGSTDPNEPVSEAQLSATVTNNGWTTGNSYMESL